MGNRSIDKNFSAIEDFIVQLPDNALLKLRPDLFGEWDSEKNAELGLDIFKMTKSMHKKAWWICPKCNSSYDATITNRVDKNCNCPYCSGKRVNHTNSLRELNPILSADWHPSLNTDITPANVTCYSGKKVWWLGECNHEWEATVSSRAKGNGCPVCNNKKVLVGFNDMWTTNPDLAMRMKNPEDGYKYTQASGKKIDWKCFECGHITRGKPIFRMLEDASVCQACSDGFGFPEKFMLNLLTQLQIEFKSQKIFNWLKDRKYDFYIPSHNIIVETHGGQHYKEQGYKSVGGKTLEEEQLNDRHKEHTARQNGITNYIIIDCRKSNLEYIKKSILNSKLSTFFDLTMINWELIAKNAQKSKVVQACEFYNINKYKMTYIDMANILGIHLSTLKDYLNKGSSIGLCSYKANDKKRNKVKTKHKTRSIVQLSLDGVFIAEWNSIADIAKSLSKKDCASISGCCRGRNKTAYGFKWVYLEDYKELPNNTLSN